MKRCCTTYEKVCAAFCFPVHLCIDKNNYKRFKKLSIMTTYFIDYIYANTLGANFYYQLVRRADGAILYANPKLENVQIECWKRCISVNDVETL